MIQAICAGHVVIRSNGEDALTPKIIEKLDGFTVIGVFVFFCKGLLLVS
jgi:hypothetical protein